MIRIDGGGLIGQRGDAAVRPFHVSEGIHSKMQKHAEAPIHLALLLPGTIHSFRCLVPGEWFYLCFSPEWVPAFRESCRALRPSRPVFTPDPTLARQRLGVTFTESLNRYRVAQSCQMLRERDWPVTRIAGQCGYGSIRNFNKAFKAITGLTPRQYRQQTQRV